MYLVTVVTARAGKVNFWGGVPMHLLCHKAIFDGDAPPNFRVKNKINYLKYCKGTVILLRVDKNINMSIAIRPKTFFCSPVDGTAFNLNNSLNCRILLSLLLH